MLMLLNEVQIDAKLLTPTLLSHQQNVAEKLGSFSAADRHLLSSWVAPEYLDDKSLEPIREQLFEESCVELANFLLPARFNEIRNALQNEQQFAHVGPYNKRCYGVARGRSAMDSAALPTMLSEYRSQTCVSHFRR